MLYRSRGDLGIGLTKKYEIKPVYGLKGLKAFG